MVKLETVEGVVDKVVGSWVTATMRDNAGITYNVRWSTEDKKLTGGAAFVAGQRVLISMQSGRLVSVKTA
jgi:hypothetical protein